MSKLCGKLSKSLLKSMATVQMMLPLSNSDFQSSIIRNREVWQLYLSLKQDKNFEKNLFAESRQLISKNSLKIFRNCHGNADWSTVFFEEFTKNIIITNRLLYIHFGENSVYATGVRFGKTKGVLNLRALFMAIMLGWLSYFFMAESRTSSSW